MTDEEYIRTARPKRPDGTAVPERGPKGWTHFLIAAAKITEMLLPEEGKDWADAADALAWSARHFDDAYDPGNIGEDIARYITRSINSVCANETLVTGYRQIGGGGQPILMPGQFWELEEPELRFKSWSFDPEAPFSQAVDLPCWIWVETGSLEKQLERIVRWRANLRIRTKYEGEWFTLSEALNVLGPFESTDAQRLNLLLQLCVRGACQGVASEYVRSFDGEPAERDIHVVISKELLGTIDPLDPRNRKEDGRLFATVGRSDYQFDSVRFDGVMLRGALSQGFLPVIETRGAPIERASTYKKAAPPPDHVILAKCDELHAGGMRVRDIAKKIREEPGFEEVPNSLVRDLTTNRYLRTGRAGIKGA